LHLQVESLTKQNLTEKGYALQPIFKAVSEKLRAVVYGHNRHIFFGSVPAVDDSTRKGMLETLTSKLASLF